MPPANNFAHNLSCLVLSCVSIWNTNATYSSWSIKSNYGRECELIKIYKQLTPKMQLFDRYIQRAGNVGCCMGYPSTVKQQELKWAEKGPRKSGENRYGQSMMVSRSRSPIRRPATPTSLSPSNPPSFVMSSAYSPYSPSKHHMPF